MAKKNTAVYAPGELSRVREKLGVTDIAEAKRMQQILGGEIGTERSEEKEDTRGGKKGNQLVGNKRPSRRVDIAAPDDEVRLLRPRPKNENYPGDDPTVPLKLGYRERVKMDQFAGQFIFEIKSSFQVFASIFSFFKEPVDYVNSRFVIRRLNEYYGKIEKLVTSSRNLFPKSNSKRNNQLKRANPFVFKIIDTLRTWNIEQIANYIADLQAHPRNVKVSDFEPLLKEIYKPLFVLSDLNTEHIKTAFKLIYKILYIESPMEAKDKYQDVIRNIISSIVEVRRDVQFGMYPLLMKLISDRFLPYEKFFIERRRRYMAFLGVTLTEQLNSSEFDNNQVENIDVDALQQGAEEEEIQAAESEEAAAETAETVEDTEEEDPNDPKVIERKAKEEAEKAEYKALEQGSTAIEALFPKAGWDNLSEYPDMFPYFAKVYNMRGGYELISPTDPLQQVAILVHILDDLFIGMRYINFGSIPWPGGTYVKISDEMSEIVNNWRSCIEESFNKNYLPRLSEYCRMLENSVEARTSPFAKKTLNELNWIKRLYFLPYYKFESIGPPPFQKNEVIAIYTQIRKLRKYLTAIAHGIEQGLRAGGSAAKAPCDGINNPWERWNFQIPNPVSRRLEALFPPERKINASLIFFSLSAITVLDYIVNNENSWAYTNRSGPFFRSLDNAGLIPKFGIDEKDKIDADQIFKDSLKKPAG